MSESVTERLMGRSAGSNDLIAWHSPLWHLLNLTHRNQNNVAGYTWGVERATISVVPWMTVASEGRIGPMDCPT